MFLNSVMDLTRDNTAYRFMSPGHVVRHKLRLLCRWLSHHHGVPIRNQLVGGEGGEDDLMIMMTMERKKKEKPKEKDRREKRKNRKRRRRRKSAFGSKEEDLMGKNYVCIRRIMSQCMWQSGISR